MTEELDILKIIADNPEISQRKIAAKTGISLGQVNFLIKKCVKKGLIKIEGQTTKSLQYNLTPQGMAEKTEMTLQYIKISYAAVIALTDKIRELMKQYKAQGYKIFVYGLQDEMMEIVKLAISNECEGYIIADKENQQNLFSDISDHRVVIFYWEDKLIPQMGNYKAVNVLS